MYQGPVVDSHVHLIDPSIIPIDWLPSAPALNRAFSMDDFADAARGIDLQKIVFVEVDVQQGRHIDEAAWINRLAGDDDRIGAIVAHAGIDQGAGVRDDLRRLQEIPKVRGIRRLLQAEDDPAFCLNPSFLDGIRLLPAFDFHFEICILHHQIAHAATMVERCPEVRFVLDHIGKPGIKAGLIDDWKRGIDRIAACDHAVCKFSGMVTEADHDDWTIAQLRPYADHVVAAFGADRLMYGGDWPVVTVASGYDRWYLTATNLLQSLDHEAQRLVFHDNARDYYRIDRTRS